MTDKIIIRNLGLTREKILEILHEENKRRLSSEYINECTKVAHIPNEWLNVTEKLQTKLLEDFGYKAPLFNSLAKNIIRRAPIIFPDDNEIKESTVQFRENLVCKCKYKIGDTIPNLDVYNLDKELIKIYDLIGTNKTLILCGSYT